MSSQHDSEPEVNEKLLHHRGSAKQESVSNGQQREHDHPQHHHHNHHHNPHHQQQHHHNHNYHHNNSMNGKPSSHYQNFPLSQGQGSSDTNTVGSTDNMKTLALDSRHELERRINRITVYLKAVSAVCFLFFIIAIVTFSVLFVQFRHDLDHHTHKPKVGEQVAVLLQHESLCVPCNDFRLGPSPEEERMLRTFSMKDSDSGLMCCVDTPQDLLDLLKLFVERRFRIEMAKGTINHWPKGLSKETAGSRHPIAAHLLMTKQETEGISQIPGRQYTIGKWIHENDMAFTIGTSYQNGRIVIPEDGLYFVYSQISFMEYYTDQHHEAFRSESGTDSPSLSIYLYRYNIHYRNGGEEKLAQNSITKCWGQSRQYGEYANYIGAVFSLRNADELFIKVSNITMVNTDYKLSYFGLFQI